jgi:hypothetical protein
MDSDVQIELRVQAFGGLLEKPRPILDHPAEVVGQAAVGKGNVAALFQNDDLIFFRKAPKSRRGRGSPSHPAHNNDFLHFCFNFLYL